ncbi:MAG: SMC family ATPase [Luteolibacter sp.]
MRLLALTVRNYRVHKELSVTFDPSRNLIGGPNESGKSTLAEAAHRALFLRAKTGGKIQKEMISTHLAGDPEVFLTFEAGGSKWELEKRFAASKGSTRLTRSGSSPLKDDEAETQLSALLKTETAGGGGAAKLLPTLWSHLWVWQGSSGEDPSAHASDHKDTLVQRLQKDGLAAVMQSATDQRVRECIAASYDELFTATGKPKAGSKPEIARTQLADAETALQRSQETAARLEQAATEHSRAEKEIADADAVLPGLREQRGTTEAKLTEVETLRRQEDTQRHAWESASTSLKQLAENDTTIRSLGEQAARSHETIAPAERMEASLLTEEQSAREASQTAEVSQRQSADAVRSNRLQHDLANAMIAAFEKAGEHQRLTVRAEEAKNIRSEVSTHREALSQLPNLTPKDLESLQKLDRTANQATASLNAMAASIELLTADLAVTLDGKPLSPGESRVLTDSGELAVGPGTRLRIRPGGGTTLSEARIQRDTANRTFATALERHTLRDLDNATSVLAQRQTLSQQIAQLETRWKALGGESITAELTTATTDLEAAKSEVQRRTAALDPEFKPAPPETLESARQLRTSLQQALDQAEETEAAARHHAAQFRDHLETAGTELQNHREQTAKARQSLRDLETKLQVLQETYGQDSAREAALFLARETEQQAAALLSTTRKALADFVPDHLATDLERFARSIAQQEARRREAENLRLVARDRLTLDGSTDPQADLSHAKARHIAAQETHDSQQRHAKAIEKLHQLFSSSREAIDRSLVQPLADRISGYLQCLFGSTAQVRVNLSDAGIEGMELLRTGDSTFDFHSLSGGAKEQVAAAVRLAMAEILAADHDGCLPILFDDAFAYTDPERVQSLQRMLDLAALRGLQVIILTCTPTDYSAFGGEECRLATIHHSTTALRITDEQIEAEQMGK